MYLTKTQVVTVTPAIPGTPGRPEYTRCEPPTPKPPRRNRPDNERTCHMVCAPRQGLGMGGTTTVCSVVCY